MLADSNYITGAISKGTSSGSIAAGPQSISATASSYIFTTPQPASFSLCNSASSAMGCDVYCALCGGPTVYVRIDDKSRKAKLREKREEALRAGMDVDSVQEEKVSYDCGYDPEVVSRADVEWARWSVVLGFNPESTHVQK